jgi:hypothetical protein
MAALDRDTVSIGGAGLCISRDRSDGWYRRKGCCHRCYGSWSVLGTAGKKDRCNTEDHDDESGFIHATKLIPRLIKSTDGPVFTDNDENDPVTGLINADGAPPRRFRMFFLKTRNGESICHPDLGFYKKNAL